MAPRTNTRGLFPVSLSLIVAGVVLLCSYGLAQQDTSLRSFLSGLIVSVTGGPGDNQLIRVNLHNHSLTLFEDGAVHLVGRIAGAGNPYDRTATPPGSYRILSKELQHVSRLSGVIMPLSMRFFEGYYFHDIPLTPTGMRISSKYSHGCIRLPSSLARIVYDWTRIGAHVEVYDASLAKDGVSSTVYYLTEDGFRQPIANEQAFVSRGFRWGDVAVIPADELTSLPLGAPLY